MGWTSDWKKVEQKGRERPFECRNCGETDIRFREWESSDGAHEDVCYSCEGCRHVWWIEGPDY